MLHSRSTNMKITLNEKQTKQLKSLITSLSPLTTLLNKSILLVLRYFQIYINKDNIEVNLCNLDIGVKYKIPCDVENADRLEKIVIEILSFKKIISKAKTLTIEVKNDNITFKSNVAIQSKNILITEDHDFIDQFFDENLKHVTTIDKNIQKDLKKVFLCASIGDSRGFLDGVNYEVNEKNNTLIFTTTDGLRLTTFEKEVNTVTKDLNNLNGIIPSMAIQILINLDIKEDINIENNNKYIIFSNDEFSLQAGRIEAQFPDYKKVIPEYKRNSLNIDRKEFLNIVKELKPFLDRKLKKAIIFSTEKHIGILIVDTYNNGDIIYKLMENPNPGTDDIIDYVCVNLEMFLDTLNTFENGFINMDFNGSNEALKFTDGSDFINIIMPMKLDDDGETVSKIEEFKKDNDL